MKQLESLGLQPKTITDMLAGGLAGRIGLGGYRGGTGPGAGIVGVGPQTMPRTGPTREGWIRTVLDMLTGRSRKTKASMGPTKKGKP